MTTPPTDSPCSNPAPHPDDTERASKNAPGGRRKIPDGGQPPDDNNQANDTQDGADDEANNPPSETTESQAVPRRSGDGTGPDDEASGASASVSDPAPALSTRVLSGVLDRIAGVMDSSKGETGPGLVDRIGYRYLSNHIRAHDEDLESYREVINQARLKRPYDRYIARSIILVFMAGIFGILVGGGLGEVFVRLDIFADLSLNAPIPVAVSPTTKSALGVLAMILIGGTIFAAITAGYFYAKPIYIRNRRAAEIDRMLPQTVTYMYALSNGGMLLIDIIERLADETETYGEVAEEFETIQSHMELFGTDLTTALQETRDTTASEDLRHLIDDIVSIIDSGGNTTPFLRKKIEKMQRQAERTQDAYIEQIDMYARIFVATGVAGVFLFLTILVVMSTIGDIGTTPLFAIVYAAMPGIGVIFWVLLDMTGADDMTTTKTLPSPTSGLDTTAVQNRLKDSPTDAVTDGGYHPELNHPRNVASRTNGHDGPLQPDERVVLKQAYNATRRRQVLESLGKPVRLIRNNPIYTMFITLPLAMLYIGALISTGMLPASYDAILKSPIWYSTIGFAAPAVGVLAPVSYYHERAFRYQRQINSELAEFLQKLSSTSETGARLEDNIRLIAYTSSGVLADDLSAVSNELQWNISLNEALTRFVNRVKNPRLTRFMKLIMESNMASGEVSKVLSVAAKNAQKTKELDDKRTSSMVKNMAVVLLGYLLFVFIALVFILELFPYFEEASQQASGTSNAGNGVAYFSFDSAVYTMVFYHAIIIQALVSGIVAGKFGYGRAASGIKYAIAGILLAVMIFLFI